MKRLIITASGRVQGVRFRSSAKSLAQSLGLVGYAKNLQNGTIKLVAEGEETALKSFLDWCYRGSLLARVDSLSYNWEDISATTHKAFVVDRSGKSLINDQASAFTNLYKNVRKKLVAVPKHIVIIPDGNRRWSREQNLPAWKGHVAGMKNLHKLIAEMKRYGVKYFTVWGFSTENWSRDDSEVKKLMGIFGRALNEFRKEVMKNKIRFLHLGRKDRLPASLVKKIEKLEEDSKDFTEYSLGVALDYGGRNELVRAYEKLQHEGGEISEDRVTSALDTKNFPDPDLIIRTGGEQRLSGIMPWQSVYAELYFSPVYFPDFGPEQLEDALMDFSERSRRFGA